AFQSVAPLSSGELWAIPIMLRLVLIENLRRIAAQMLAVRACREEATRVLLAWTETGVWPANLGPFQECGHLVLHIVEQLQEEVAGHAERYRELEGRLAAQELTVQRLIYQEHQRQAANQVSIGNVITSMLL